MPNSEVKRHIADGSVGFPHVRVGHRQALKYRKSPLAQYARGLFLYLGYGELLSLLLGPCDTRCTAGARVRRRRRPVGIASLLAT